MSTKRELIKLLKHIKNDPRLLSPSECDELITMLDGIPRPRKRPEVKIFGGSLRRGNWTAIADLVFGFLENSEELSNYENELIELGSPDFLENILSKVPAEKRPSRRSELEERISEEQRFLKTIITSMRPRSAKNLAEAKRMASDYLKNRGKIISVKQIENQLSSMREAAGLNRLGLNEWRALRDEYKESRIKRENKHQ